MLSKAAKFLGKKGVFAALGLLVITLLLIKNYINQDTFSTLYMFSLGGILVTHAATDISNNLKTKKPEEKDGSAE
jgi:hypothetical protein